MNNEELIMNNEKCKGITLIALVITIIILLILAGVTINVLIGDNGLFNTAKKAADDYKRAEINERLLIAIADLQAEKMGGATLDDITEEWLDSKMPDCDCTVRENIETGTKTIIIKKDGTIQTYIIDEELNITEMETKVGYFYDIIETNENSTKISLSLFGNIGINKVELPGQDPITYKGEKEIDGIEYTMQKKVEYTVKVTLENGEVEELKISINDYYDVKINLQDGISIDNKRKKVGDGTTYEATVSVQDAKYFLYELKVTMGGVLIEDQAKVNVATRKN